MRSSVLAIFAAAGALVSAAPLEARQESCAAYPWFIVPYASADCTGQAAAYQPNPGPTFANPQNVYCQSLWNPAGAPETFGSVAVNNDPCPGQKWQINLYTDGGCGLPPTVITSDTCVPAPSQFAAGRFEKFDAILLPQ